MKSLDIATKCQAHSLGLSEPSPRKRASRRQLLKKNSLDSALTIEFPIQKTFDKVSPRLQAVHDLLSNAILTERIKIGKGYGNNTTIWKVSVKITVNYDERSVHNLLCVEKNLKNCCMKELLISDSATEDIESFSQEIGKLSRFPTENDHIIRFIGYHQTKEHIRIFTKLYDGSLNCLISHMKKNNMTFTQAQIIKCIKQIASGLAVVHSRRMMHRDLKCANIFYEGSIDNLNDLKLILGDFGESKVIDMKNKAKTCVGTNVWIAPEVLQSCNKNEYSFCADVYSFGMVVYELMTLHTPFSEKKSFSAVTSILKGEKPPLTYDQREKYSDILNLWNKMIISRLSKITRA